MVDCTIPDSCFSVSSHTSGRTICHINVSEHICLIDELFDRRTYSCKHCSQRNRVDCLFWIPTDQSNSTGMNSCCEGRLDEQVMITFRINEGSPWNSLDRRSGCIIMRIPFYNVNDPLPTKDHLIRKLPMIMTHNSCIENSISLFSL
jgi:hypothetical protein